MNQQIANSWGRLFPEFSDKFPLHTPVAVLASHTQQLQRVPTETVGLRIFFAIRGFRFDGHDFLDEAVTFGADVLVVEEDFLGSVPTDKAIIPVKHVQRQWVKVQQRRFNSPDEKLRIHAVTGTDGKTTTVFALQQLLGKTCARMGTIDRQAGFDLLADISTLTTADAADTYRFLQLACDSGCTDVAMEMSSHALVGERLFGLKIESAVFTNLTREHLDFHRTLPMYFDAKCRLFDGCGNHCVRHCAINEDDAWGKKLLKNLREAAKTSPSGQKICAFGSDSDCDVQLLQRTPDEDGQLFQLRIGEKKFDARTRLLGHFNAMNLLGALAIASFFSNLDELLERLATVIAPPGRLERIPLSCGSTGFVDYAHTPNALQAALGALREHFPQRRIIVVFGCGGNRDRGKRPFMGRTAELLADEVIVTSDNPRDECPITICGEICGGFLGARPKIITDRAEAISLGVGLAKKNNSILLVAGKGHEQTQIIGDKKVPFYDASVMRTCAARTEI
ncbi:MAG: UDP-N-acetylmuramoyl-L-alanyl-D-glutamate--2,6-diaminopimelate ligase [Puniceicoccales bacterium]|jgi:UDP-N-acetylmuramyl-tripeptide synthetase|nr:UDP-N-acetylmuramoyl-L-alanyl-D-glutamate--2,6-diaminopimelate ligase [Puniceicoccales bacterium]